MSRKLIATSTAGSSQLNGLLTGEQALQDAASSLKPVSNVLFNQIRTTPLNPRYNELSSALIIQANFKTAAGEPRHASSSHVNKLSRNRAVSWALHAKNGWLKSEAGKVWLAAEARHGHKFNFDSPNEKEKDVIWKAYMRRWLERVERMLLREPPDAVTLKRWEAILGRPPQVSTPVPDGPDRKRIQKLVTEWNELIALSANVAKDGLISPLRLRPMTGYFEIVGGERRYWACRMANIDYIPSVGSTADDLSAMSQTIHENLDRLDVSRGGWVIAFRRYFEKLLGEPCGPTNKQLTISVFENEFAGRSKSWAHRWRGICKLPEDSQLLADICSGDLNNVQKIDEAVRAYHRRFKLGETPEPNRVTDPENNDPDAKPPANPQPKPPANPAPAASLKVRLPGTEAGVKLLTAISVIDGVDDSTKAVISKAMNGWRGAPDKQRKKFLEEVLSALTLALDPLDEVDA
jgi:hypothetical protein